MRQDERQMRELRMAAGYTGQSKPIARAKADAEAEALAETRRRWKLSEQAILAENPLQPFLSVADRAALLEEAKLLGKLAASRLKALYPLVECDREIDGGPIPQSFRHLPQATQQELHRSGVVTKGNDGCHNPSLDQECKLGVSGVGHIHGDSLQVAVDFDATPAASSCEGAQG
jgi:hypothetical protein